MSFPPPVSKTPSDTAVILVNLGTPEAPTPLAVTRFLAQFLSDRRVVDLPGFLWKGILRVILPFRARRVARLYESIWMQEGSPLRIYTQRLSLALERSLQEVNSAKIPVFFAMTYGSPNISTILQNILQNKSTRITRLIVLPLFPQYSKSTTAAVWDKITFTLKRQTFIPTLHFIHEYANETDYQKALAESITKFWNKHPRGERLLFSFHGVPKRFELQGDTYVSTCKSLAKQVARLLNIPENSYEISFQSRFGFAPWVRPSTSQILTRWAAAGIHSVDVISPSFAVDCLETLEELDKQMRHIFLSSGGKYYQYIPALNDSQMHVTVLKSLIQKFF